MEVSSTVNHLHQNILHFLDRESVLLSNTAEVSISNAIMLSSYSIVIKLLATNEPAQFILVEYDEYMILARNQNAIEFFSNNQRWKA